MPGFIFCGNTLAHVRHQYKAPPWSDYIWFECKGVPLTMQSMISEDREVLARSLWALIEEPPCDTPSG